MSFWCTIDNISNCRTLKFSNQLFDLFQFISWELSNSCFFQSSKLFFGNWKFTTNKFVNIGILELFNFSLDSFKFSDFLVNASLEFVHEVFEFFLMVGHSFVGSAVQLLNMVPKSVGDGIITFVIIIIRGIISGIGGIGIVSTPLLKSQGWSWISAEK